MAVPAAGCPNRPPVSLFSQTTVTPASIQIGATPAADDTTPSYAHALLSLAPETVSQPDFADAGNASDNVYSGALVFGSNTGAEGPEFVVDVPAEGALMLLEALESIEEPVHTQGRTLAAGQ